MSFVQIHTHVGYGSVGKNKSVGPLEKIFRIGLYHGAEHEVTRSFLNPKARINKMN